MDVRDGGRHRARAALERELGGVEDRATRRDLVVDQ
jgi:hypothetical protein